MDTTPTALGVVLLSFFVFIPPVGGSFPWGHFAAVVVALALALRNSTTETSS